MGIPEEWCVPQYRNGALCDVLPSAAAAVGCDEFDNVLSLPRAAKVCVLIIDGLGHTLLKQHTADAPTLAALHEDARILTAGFPSTTVTSISSLALGMPPGEHGMLGYRLRVPGTSNTLHCLHWDQPVDPRVWQPHTPVTEQLQKRGFSARHVAHTNLQFSGLSQAAWHDTPFLGAPTPGMLAARTLEALESMERGVVYSYYGDLDMSGHLCGAGSDAWIYQLRIVDALVRQVQENLPPDTLLLITGDHGMVNVSTNPEDDARVDLDREDSPTARKLRDGVEIVSGEMRVRYLHTVDGQAETVAQTWQDILGDRVHVMLRETAIDAGLYGSRCDDQYAERLGDVIVVSRAEFAILATAEDPRKTVATGMHGALTPQEQHIPLLLIRS